MNILDCFHRAIFTFLFCLAFCLAARGETYLDRLLKLKLTEEEIQFYGRLEDQYGEPVKNATILYETERYGLLTPIYKSGVVKTGDDGIFEIHSRKAGVLYIDEIVIQGYEFERTGNGNTSRFDFRSSRRERYRPDKENPIVFHLRKKEFAGTYLIEKNDFIMTLRNGVKMQWARDLAKGWNANARTRKNPDCFWDIECSGEVDLEKKEWRVTFRTNGEQSGIQIRDEFLYEAPEDGYEKSLTVAFPFGQECSGRHFYLRLREPGMYARFDMDRYSYSKEDSLSLLMSGVINPYGDRSLEPVKCLCDIPRIYNAAKDNRKLYEIMMDSVHIYNRIGDSGEDAFKRQQLAPRPPFEELIKEGKLIY